MRKLFPVFVILILLTGFAWAVSTAGISSRLEGENQVASADSAVYVCTLIVRTDNMLSGMDRLNPEKAELVPEDGIIFSSRTVEFSEGESVFDVLLREMQRARIHMEFANVPFANFKYIKGINNIYEGDSGELSGWSYSVNGLFPHYSLSNYLLKPGDVVEIVYFCDFNRAVNSIPYANSKSNVGEAAFVRRSEGVDRPTLSKAHKNNEASV